MKHRKHRVIVEITTSKPMTEIRATKGLQFLLNRIDIEKAPIWITQSIYAEKLTTKQFSRVFTAAKIKWGREEHPHNPTKNH